MQIYIYIYFLVFDLFLQVTYPSSSLRAITVHRRGGGGWATGPKRQNPWWLPAVSEGLSGCLPTLGRGHLLPCVKWPQFQALTLFFFFWNYFLFISTRYQCLSVHADTTRMSVWPGSQVTATRVAESVLNCQRSGSCLAPAVCGLLQVDFLQVVQLFCHVGRHCWHFFPNLTTFCGQKCKNSEGMWQF